MKKTLQKIGITIFASIVSAGAWSQCPTVTCTDVVVNSDSSSCGAIVNYPIPTGIDTCDLTTQTFNYTGTIDSWIVPAGVTSITVEVSGAEGGNSTSSVAAGLGATMIGDLIVTPGQTLSILVGQNNNAGNGGGGGSFVVDALNNPLIIAGGGGGGAAGIDSPDKHGQITSTGGTGAGGGGTGGTAGSGGNVGASFASGAGGGLLTDGTDGWAANSGGDAFVNGGAGANVGFGIGGFGGGGNGSGNVVGGGGGGYSGGGGGSNSVGSGGVGGGGASINNGTNQTNTTGDHLGDGIVIITYGGATTSTLESGISTGGVFPVGVSTVNYSVVNALGDSAFCSFTVTVIDSISPSITVPANITTCDANASGLAAVTSDNCPGETVTYVLTGATVGTGSGDVSGTTFSVGITTVTYTVTDASGNTSTSSFDVEILPLPLVTMSSFSPDTICVDYASVALPSATPAGGSYSGSGVVGTDFDPSVAGVGSHWITYTYADSLGCPNSDSAQIVVDGCLGIDTDLGLIGLSIYPNPGNGIYTLEFNDAQTGNFNIEVTDVNGRIVYSNLQSGSFGTQVIDIREESNGVYLIQITSESKSGVYRIIKE